MNHSYTEIESYIKTLLEEKNTQSITAGQINEQTLLVNGDLYLDSLDMNEIGADLESSYSILFTPGQKDLIQSVDTGQALIWVTFVLANA